MHCETTASEKLLATNKISGLMPLFMRSTQLILILRLIMPYCICIADIIWAHKLVNGIRDLPTSHKRKGD